MEIGPLHPSPAERLPAWLAPAAREAELIPLARRDPLAVISPGRARLAERLFVATRIREFDRYDRSQPLYSQTLETQNAQRPPVIPVPYADHLAQSNRIARETDSRRNDVLEGRFARKPLATCQPRCAGGQPALTRGPESTPELGPKLGTIAPVSKKDAPRLNENYSLNARPKRENKGSLIDVVI